MGFFGLRPIGIGVFFLVDFPGRKIGQNRAVFGPNYTSLDKKVVAAIGTIAVQLAYFRGDEGVFWRFFSWKGGWQIVGLSSSLKLQQKNRQGSPT